MAAPAMAGGMPGGPGRGGIVVNAPITINVGAGTDADALEKVVVRAFEQHRYELLRAIERERERKERTELS